MNQIVRIKRSFTSGNVPPSLDEGELAINVVDRRFWIGTATGIVELFAVADFVQKTGDTMTGDLTIANPFMDARLTLNAIPSTRQAVIRFQRNGSARWVIRTVAGGTSSGDDLFFTRYNDAGNTNLGDSLRLLRGTGEVLVEQDPIQALGVATKQYADNASADKLPLAGGIMNTLTDAGGIGITMTNASASKNALTINNNATAWGTGITINNNNLTSGSAGGLIVQNYGNTGMTIRNRTGSTTGLVVYGDPGSNNSLRVQHYGTGSAIRITSGQTTTADPLVIEQEEAVGTSTRMFVDRLGNVNLTLDPTAALHAVTKRYCDANSTGVISSPTAPTNPPPNQLWFDSTDGRLFIWFDSQWVEITGGAEGGANVSTDIQPPADPSPGDLWFSPTRGQLFIWFDDGSSAQWIVTVNPPGGGVGGAGGQGVTNGSEAAPGDIGEFRQMQGTTVPTYADGNTPEQNAALSLTLSPGDWDVSANCYLDAGPGILTSALVWLQAASITTPPVSAIGHSSGTYRQAGLALPPTRFNLAATTSVLLITRVLSSGIADAVAISGSGLSQFVLRARRMR